MKIFKHFLMIMIALQIIFIGSHILQGQWMKIPSNFASIFSNVAVLMLLTRGKVDKISFTILIAAVICEVINITWKFWIHDYSNTTSSFLGMFVCMIWMHLFSEREEKK